MDDSKTAQMRIWKQAENGLLAHVYEHIAAQALDDLMSAYGQQHVIDYDMFGSTYGLTCFLDIYPQTNDAVTYLTKAIDAFQKSTITNQAIATAANECGCEFRRVAIISQSEKLAKKIQFIHEQQWGELKNFTQDIANDSTSVNTLFSTSSISFSDVSEAAFRTMTIEYSLPVIKSERAAVKAAGVIILQALALNFIANLRTKYVLFDQGDEWAEGSDDIGYRTIVVFLKENMPDSARIEGLFSEYLEKTTKSDFILGLQNLFKKYADDPSRAYFGMYEMNKILGGMVIGGKGWLEAGDLDTITRLLKAASINAYES